VRDALKLLVVAVGGVCVIWGPNADLGILFSSVREFFDLLTIDQPEFLLLDQMQKKNSSDVFWHFFHVSSCR